MVMASDAVPGFKELTQQTDKGVSSTKQYLQDVEDRLMTLSDKMTLCNRVLKDLKDLSGVVKRKSLQDVSLPLQK